MAENAHSGAISHAHTDPNPHDSAVLLYSYTDPTTFGLGDPLAECHGYSDPDPYSDFGLWTFDFSYPYPDSGTDSDTDRYAHSRTDPNTTSGHRGHQ
jgi:hypothetical protein